MLNGAITVLVIATRNAFPVLIVLGVFSLFGVAGSMGRRFPPLWPFASLFIPYVIICVWGGANWAAEQDYRTSHWRSVTLLILCGVSLAYVVWIPIRFRRTLRWWLLIPAGVLSLALSLWATFVGGMAIANSWL
jgi:hypothetical protein